MTWRRRKSDDDLDRELLGHLELEAEELRDNGLPEGEARRAALRALGNATLVRELIHDMSRWAPSEQIVRDVRQGLRQLRRTPAFTIAVIVTLAFGVAAHTAVLSAVDTVLLKPLPYAEPDRLVTVSARNVERARADKVTVGDFLDWRARTRTLSALAFSWDTAYTLTGAGGPQTLSAFQLSENFFAVLGARPALGRVFLPEDGTPGHDHVAVLSAHLWRERFGGDTALVGRAIQLDGLPYTVIGVMSDRFAHPTAQEDLWTPLPLPSELASNYSLHVLHVVARLAPAVTLAAARVELASFARQNERDHPQTNTHWTAQLDPIRDAYTGDLKPALWALYAAALFMLVVACASVVNVALARASRQRGEVAVRRALGATGPRLFTYFLTQGVALSIAGTAAGVLLALVGVRILSRMFDQQTAHLSLPATPLAWITPAVLLTATAIAMIVGIMLAALPVIVAGCGGHRALKIDGRGPTENRFARRLRGGLIVGQIALSLVLVVGSGLLLRSVAQLQDRTLGFSTDHVLTLLVVLPRSRYGTVARTSLFLDEVLTGVRSTPGVDEAGATTAIPLSGMDARRPFSVPGRTDLAGSDAVAHFRVVTSDYFKVLRVRVRAGRVFDEHDRAGAKPVVIINAQLARRLWPSADPIGKSMLVADTATPEPREIVGVVDDIRHGGLGAEPPDEVYRPAAQTYWPFFGLVVHTTVDPLTVAAAVRDAIWSVDKDEPIGVVRSLDGLAADSIALRRSSMRLLVVLATIAILLASFGIHGMLSYGVRLRQREIGIRLALGATQPRVIRSIVGYGVGLASIGLTVGLVAAAMFSRLLATLLFGISRFDTVTYSAAAISMLAIALGAAYLPARRAARIDPLTALRED